ncbi:MAG: substrate-binding domain-containing protein [Kiritimatiellae bacterium]|nr:substrate-binding domain-containing protein [Kiritimatiellia bacterium]
MAQPRILYLSMIAGNPSHERKLAGIRRYCAARGWEAVPILRDDATREALPALLRRHRPVGCVVEGVACRALLPPSLFRGVPVSYIAYPWRVAGNRPNFHFDSEVVARAAFRELSSGNPPSYAAVGVPYSSDWSRLRVRWFSKAAAESGAKCLAFPSRPPSARESEAAFTERLAPWLARLPEHCAIFAACDATALLVTRAARAAMRHIPKSLTLLSVDNFAEICESAEPPISSLQLDFEREGFIAAKALVEGVPRADSDNRDRLGPLMVARRKSTAGRGRHEPWILEAVEIIRREACDGLTVAGLLRRFPQSRRNFERRFREATGHGIHDEILHVRLEKACAILAGTKVPVGAVADFCGFRSRWALDDLFRARFKMGLLEWRRLNSR